MVDINVLEIPAVKKKKPNENGKKIFQPITINWSKRYRGTLALIKINQVAINTTLIEKTSSGKIETNKKSYSPIGKTNFGKIGSQPPKNRITKKEDIRSILEYSPKKNAANKIPEYSIL